MTKNFALIGAAGFVAPRHMKAIKDNGHQLLAAMDPNDSVGILDTYFPEAAFFTEFERFDRHLEKLKRAGQKIDYIVVCSPNYLHDAHIRFGLRIGADVICEKPMVLNLWNIDPLRQLEVESGNKVFNILQLRLHPSILKLKQDILEGPKDKIYDVDLTYITSRGLWYYASWKGDLEKSGGIATNIGIHFFDVLLWIFGKVIENTVHLHNHDRASGCLKLEKAKVRWFLSIHPDTLPKHIQKNRTYRCIEVEGQQIEFSDGFTDLHTASYHNILAGHGFGIEDIRASTEVAYQIRKAKSIGLIGDYHPYCNLPTVKHPFL
ncbi:MAG: Gfo/Idh/MocA family oxidoreductase [Saprospiraceae bacterium]